jgi:hypothetical protein
MLSGGAVPVLSALSGGGVALARGGLWQGVVKGGGANVRSAPSVGADLITELQPGADIAVDNWVAGSEVYPTLITWGHLSSGDGYVYGSAIQPEGSDYAPPVPAGMPSADRWIDVNLTYNIITVYSGPTPLRSFPTSPGRPGWETTRGLHHVLKQASVDNMSGPGWHVDGVPWVSYFLGDGEAIHARTWDLDAISLGVPSSHGCLGVSIDNAAYVYDIASPGTPVFVHD